MNEKAWGGLDYRQLFLDSPNVYLLLSPDLTILDANEAYEATVGIARDQLVGNHVFDALPPKLQDAMHELGASFQRVLEQRVPDTVPMLHYPIPDPEAPDGWLDRYWSVRNLPLLDAHGEVAGILNCPIDVTELLGGGGAPFPGGEAAAPRPDAYRVGLINRQLTRERRRFQQLIRQAPGFIAVGGGPEHVFEIANDAYYQLVGHRDIIGQPVRQALPELEGQGFYELLDQVYASGEPFIGRAIPIQLQTTAGAPPVQRHIDFIYQPILDEGGDVSGIFVQGHDVTEAHELSRVVSHQATHDDLTGLYNRREFERRMCAAVAELQEQAGLHSLLFLDIDQFKVVNDTCGHLAGDEMLRQISMLLASHVSDRHTLARLGGDEFGILLTHTGPDEAQAFAESLRATIDGTEFVHSRRVFGCAASVGVVSFGPEIGTPERALSAADSACLVAKEKGRNRVQVHHQDDDQFAARLREMDWVSRLRLALAEDRLVLYAQRIEAAKPQPDATIRLELLVRLRETDGTIVPPMAFIPAAERYGFMPALDRFVILQAFDFLQSLPDDARARIHLSINLSGTSLNDGRLPDFIREQVRKHPALASLICFEITETAAVQNLVSTSRLMLELKAMGFCFALDDFGTGMSSLGYLKHLPVDCIKIDGVFIRNIASDPVDAAMVEAMARVAQIIGIESVAEFVETEESRTMVARLGVGYVQGYGVHVPEPLAQAVAGCLAEPARCASLVC